MDDQCPHYDPKVHRKLYQNCNCFIMRKYDGRIKKCRGCNKSFKTSCSTTPEFVIAHREPTTVYGGIKGSKRLLMTERDFFYHCDPECIRPRHPYFAMLCDIVVSQHRQLSEGDVEHLNTLETFP